MNINFAQPYLNTTRPRTQNLTKNSWGKKFYLFCAGHARSRKLRVLKKRFDWFIS